MPAFTKKAQMIIQRSMVSIGGTLGCTPSQHDIQQTQPGRGAGGDCPPVSPFLGRHEHVDPGYVEVERGEGSGGGQPAIDPFDIPNLDIPSFSLGLTPLSQSLPSGSGTFQMPLPPGLGFAPFQSPHSISFGFFGFCALPPPGTAGSSTPYQSISQASSFDEEERMDDMDVVQYYGFGHRVGKKTTRLTPSYWSWTLPTSRMISHDELVRKILKYRDMDPNLWNVRIPMRMPSYYEVYRMFYFNLYSMNNDEEMRYLWTLPPHHAKERIHILVEFEHIQQQSIPITHNRNTTTLPEYISVVTQMVFYEPSMLYSAINNNDDEVDGSGRDDAVSSQSGSDDDNDPEEEFQTPLNPVNPINSVTENIVPQWESSQ
ncbi:hypothetical protein M9H77_17469 [Catharanthus roseus]|uniref:Uncharacterized protein n=1 Tax=Catharanthus roseus TaxID=4058 RepID=A0ACC0B4P3_CATRO|nr:hypothetical protein M9H77_17469 [Catharanthus roseus]